MALIEPSTAAHIGPFGRRTYTRRGVAGAFHLALHAEMLRSRMEVVVLAPTSGGAFVVIPRSEFRDEWVEG